jgi:hypothetical protein
VGAIPATPVDFDVIMAGNWLAAFDNLDDYASWHKDRLAMAATGAAPTKRKLYSDSDLVRSIYRAFVILTSRDPRYIRDDVAERMLVLNTRRIPSDQFRAEYQMIRDLEAHREHI